MRLASSVASHCNTKFEPMNPAPPVTTMGFVSIAPEVQPAVHYLVFCGICPGDSRRRLDTEGQGRPNSAFSTYCGAGRLMTEGWSAACGAGTAQFCEAVSPVLFASPVLADALQPVECRSPP